MELSMFEKIKPGHVLRFNGTDPGNIVPPAATAVGNDITAETLWTAQSALGRVDLLSHPTGPLDMAAEVARKLRPGISLTRLASYSDIAREHSSQNRFIGAALCDFVGYVDGRSNYIATDRAVISKDFSGCLMVSYVVGGQRRVAHSAASQDPARDCKQAFLTTLRGLNAQQLIWFKPYTNDEAAGFIQRFAVARAHVNGNVNRMTTFGVVTPTGEAYAIEAFKPLAAVQNDWIVTAVRRPQIRTSWTV
jgi:hypothetical protein